MASIFSIKVPTKTRKQIEEVVIDLIKKKDQRKRCITTLNPEILLHAFRNESYRQVLSSSFCVIDGFGIKLVSWLRGIKTGTRITGVDLTKFILKRAQKSGNSVSVIIKKGGLSDKNDVEKCLKEKFFLKNFMVEEVEVEKKEIMLNSNPDILFVALGAPFQEEFVDKVVKNNSGIRLAMGVGGTFDFFTQKATRAPEILRRLGFEWFWRFMHQTNRWERMLNALIVFPIFGFIYLKK